MIASIEPNFVGSDANTLRQKICDWEIRFHFHCIQHTKFSCRPEFREILMSTSLIIDKYVSSNTKLNDDKTEAMRFHTSAVSSSNLPSTIALGNSNIAFSDQARDLRFIFDSDLSLKQHFIRTCQAAYLEIRRISSMRHYLTQDATKTLVSALILSRLDYCNSLLACYPQPLLYSKFKTQVQNSFSMPENSNIVHLS